MTINIQRRNRYATQGALVLAELRKRPLTYRQMLNLGVGNSPWKRAVESINPEREQIIKGKHASGFTTWRVVPVRKGAV
jgi:hypothetical protein